MSRRLALIRGYVIFLSAITAPPMQQIAHYLFILGLDSCESLTALKSAYRRAMLQWHPDKHQNDPAMQTAATERAKEINAAFDHLSKFIESSPLPSFNTD